MNAHLRLFLIAAAIFLPSAIKAQEISEGPTSWFVNRNQPKTTGVVDFPVAEYRDSLISHFDKIRRVADRSGDTGIFYYDAVFGSDTLTYKVRQKIINSISRDDKGSYRELEVESDRYPHQRFTAKIDGLESSEISGLTARMQTMKTSDKLMNNEETCIFYALERMFKVNGICPDPIITRNSNFADGRQLNAFFDHFLTAAGEYPCKAKSLRNTDLPDNCVLAFINAHGEIIHAVFFHDGIFYSKNGFWSPIATKKIREITRNYSRYDTDRADLSSDGLDELADKIIIYGIDKDIFGK
jgi:hypothetical protein